MTWWSYVRGAVGPDTTPADIARALDTSRSTISRWTKGDQPSPEYAIAFARAYGRPPVEALAAAGWLTADEAGMEPGTTPPPAQIHTAPDSDLLRELQRRLTGSAIPESIRRDLPQYGQ